MHPVFRDSPVPRYSQLADLLRQRIAKGVWKKGGQLPSLFELMAEFDVARVTVRQAIKVLTTEGLLSAQQGRGTFVIAAPDQGRRLRMETSLQSLADMYRHDKPQLTLIEESRTAPPLLPNDGQPASKYRYLRRVHSRHGVAFCVISIWLAEEVFRRRPKRFREQAVIPVLLDMPEPLIATARQAVSISAAGVEVAGHLNIAVNFPVAEVRRVFCDDQGTVIYLGEVTYRGDYVHFDMDLKP